MAFLPEPPRDTRLMMPTLNSGGEA